MGTNRVHPSVRRHQQDRKRMLRSYRKPFPHHNRKWWKAWTKTWNATHCRKWWQILGKNYEYEEYDVEEIPCCPKCGSKAYIVKDIVEGFYFGWSVGCPRFCNDDGIHGTTPDTPEEDLYSIHRLKSREECVQKWKERVKHLIEKDGEQNEQSC